MLQARVYLLREKPRKTDTKFYISSAHSPGSPRKHHRKDVDRLEKAKMPQRSSSRAGTSKIILISPRMKKQHQHKNFSKVKPKNSSRDKTKLDIFQKFPTLTRTMLNEVSSVWDRKKTTETVVKNFAVNIRVADLKTLSDSEWLNNDIINFYMNLIVQRSKREEYLPKVYSMNTFFYPKLKKDGFNSLKRWTKMVDIFTFDMIIVPIFSSAHWSLAIIDFKDKSIKLYDSMSLTSTKKCLSLLKQYLNEESLDKKKKPYNTSDWKSESVENIPQQQNFNDCGVFVCTFAEYLAANRKFNFTQEDIDYFRKKITYEILHSELLNFNVRR